MLFRLKFDASSVLQPLTGALVGGPDASDNFEDDRTNDKQSRVSLDTNAALHIAVAALRHLEMKGTLHSSDSPVLHFSPVSLFAALASSLFLSRAFGDFGLL